MSPEGNKAVCTGVEVRRDEDRFAFKPGEKPVWRGVSLEVAVDENGQLTGECPAMASHPDGKCPHVEYEKAMVAIRRSARRNGISLDEGFVVTDGEGREMIGLAFEAPTPPCHPGYGLRGGPATTTNTMSRGADCPRSPAPEQEGDPRPSDVYQIADPALRAGIAELLGKK